MPKFEIKLDEKILRRAERYAASHGLTIEAIVANVLQSKAHTPASQRDWEPFKNLLGMVRLVLLIDWDPIGVTGYRGAMDEYDRYAEDVHKLLETGATQEELTAHLRYVANTRMGLRERPELPAVAAKLRRVFDNATE